MKLRKHLYETLATVMIVIGILLLVVAIIPSNPIPLFFNNHRIVVVASMIVCGILLIAAGIKASRQTKDDKKYETGNSRNKKLNSNPLLYIVAVGMVLFFASTLYYRSKMIQARTSMTNCAHPIDIKHSDPMKTRTETITVTNTPLGLVTFVRHFRGNAKIFSSMTHSNGGTRMFYIDGEPQFSESDEDGDGFYESIWVHNIMEYEMFTRNRDGSIEPVSAENLIEHRKSLQKAMQKGKQKWNSSLENVEKKEGIEIPNKFFWK